MWNDFEPMNMYSNHPMPVQELVDGFDDWAAWLRSLLPTLQESSTLPAEVLLLTEGEDAATCAAPPHSADEDRWQDDGGESAEMV